MSTQNSAPYDSVSRRLLCGNLGKIRILAVVGVLPMLLAFTGCSQQMVPLTPPEFIERTSAPDEMQQFEIKDPIQVRMSVDADE